MWINVVEVKREKFFSIYRNKLNIWKLYDVMFQSKGALCLNTSKD